MPVSAPFRGLQATSLLVVLTYTCFFSARQRGRRDAQADTYLNAAERSAFEHGASAEEGATARRLSQVLGREILFIDADADFHGCTIDGVIYLGAKSERSVLATVAHEYTHLLEGKGLYKKLRDFVFDTLAGEGATAEDLRAAKRAEHELYAGLDDAQIDREIVAEFVETRLLTDEQVMRAVVRREGKSFARRLLDTLRGLIEKIKAALHIGDADAEQLKMLERGRDILAEVIRSEEAATDAVAVTFSMVGKNKNGIEVYETSDAVKKLSYNERKALFLEVMKNQYRGRTARFVRNGHAYYALFSDGDMRKNIYGDKRSDTRGWKAKITAGADGDIFNLVENAAYNGSMAESGKNNSAHRSVHHWDYFIKTVQIDGRLYDLTANVRKTDSGEFVYFLQFNENKKTEAAPLLRATNGSFNRMLTASDDTSLSQDSPDVNSHSMQNSKNDADIDGFSVGGIKAKTADVGRLADAERMEQGGADSETVRRETGWYRGYDGKWRFEIDDSKMRFINHREESRRTWKLDELIRHDALFAAYPELRDYTVLNFGISDDVEAAFYPGLNRITLDPRLSRAEKRTALIHEIQHAIQLIEGFTAGATTDYWRGSLKTAEEKQLELRLRDFAAPDIFFEADMRKLLEGTPTAERDAAQTAMEKHYGETPVREYVDLYNRLRDLRAEREQDAERAYRNTAGEIEAVDVANRLGLSERQRAETRPDIDRTNVRFSNEHPMFTMEARQTDSEGIMKLDDANIDKTKEKMTWLEANDLLEKQQGLSYRFYASDDPMSRAGYAMFADDHEQNGDAYGGDKPRAFSVREDDLVPVWELSEKIAEARHETDEYTPWILEDYAELSDEDFADMFNPSDIVDSAYAWDNEELTEWFYNHVAEPNKIGGVKTSDGAIVFDKDLIRRNIPAEIVYTQASSNEEFLAKYGDDTEADPDIRFSVGGEQTDAGAEVSDADKRFAPVESAIKLLQGGADLWRTLRETGASPREIALRMATSGESDTAIRELTGLYRDALGVWTYDKAWLDAHVPDITDTRELRAGYKLGTVDEQMLELAPEEVKASRRRLLDSAKLPNDADAVRVRQTAANLHRGLRPTAAEFAEDRKTAAAKEAARLITEEKVPSADAAIRTGALLADIADVLEKKKVRAETVTRLTAQVRGENGAWETDNAAMTKIIRAGSKQLDVQDFTDFLFENAKELTESSYNSQYGHKETYALNKLGVQIQNPIVDIAKYGTKPSELIANEREQEELKRYIENEYVSAAHPSPAERADARDVKREFLPDMKTVGEVARFYLDRTKWRMLYCVCI